MTRAVVILPEAEDEIRAAVRWYEDALDTPGGTGQQPGRLSRLSAPHVQLALSDERQLHLAHDRVSVFRGHEQTGYGLRLMANVVRRGSPPPSEVSMAAPSLVTCASLTLAQPPKGAKPSPTSRPWT